jgi:hypothetical protein
MKIKITESGCRYGGRALSPGTVIDNPKIKKMPPLWKGKAEKIEKPRSERSVTNGGKHE